MRVRSWFYLFQGHCEQQAMRDERLFMSLVIHYWIGDVQDFLGVSASEMTLLCQMERKLCSLIKPN